MEGGWGRGQDRGAESTYQCRLVVSDKAMITHALHSSTLYHLPNSTTDTDDVNKQNQRKNLSGLVFYTSEQWRFLLKVYEYITRGGAKMF